MCKPALDNRLALALRAHLPRLQPLVEKPPHTSNKGIELERLCQRALDPKLTGLSMNS